MNAFFGQFNIDGRQVDQQSFRRACEHPSISDNAIVCNESNSVCLVQPTHPFLSSNGSDSLLIACDARLDYRDDLRASLGLRDADSTLPDSALVLRAYVKWGHACIDHLEGDFAFAIFDANTSTIFAARDHFGVRPFYYSLSGTSFAFSSSIRTLLRLPHIARDVDDVAIANFLERSIDDPELTFYASIRRLAPAHFVVATPNGISVGRYWEPDVHKAMPATTDNAFAEAYLNRLSQSVRNRTSESSSVGATLSGGLDSSSIVAVMRRDEGSKPVPTFSAVFNDVPESDERTYIDAIISQGGLAPHFVRADSIDPLADIRAMLQCSEQPFDAPNFFVHWNLYRAAHDAGVTAILDGDGGDITVSHGIARLAELFAKGHLAKLTSEVRALSGASGRSIARLLRRHVVRPFVPLALRRLRHRSHAPGGQQWLASSMMSREFVQRISANMHERASAMYYASGPRSVRESQSRELTGDLVSSELELYYKGATHFGLQSRHPFFEKRLVEFCLALPSDQKLHAGFNRVVARRAMDGLLPDSVRWRTDKGDFTPNFVRSLQSASHTVHELVFQDTPSNLLSPYVDMSALNDAYATLISSKATLTDAYQLFKAATLASWLNMDLSR